MQCQICPGVQVMEWTQQMLAIGESFSSAESATLRDALARQSGKFFEAFHAGNMQVDFILRPCPQTSLVYPTMSLGDS